MTKFGSKDQVPLPPIPPPTPISNVERISIDRGVGVCEEAVIWKLKKEPSLQSIPAEGIDIRLLLGPCENPASFAYARTWYTGCAGWMHRVALESVLGMKIEGGKKLRLKPCIPEGWAGFKLTYRLPDSNARYQIDVVNAAVAKAAVVAVTVDAASGTVEDGAAVIDLHDDGGVLRVRVEMGARRDHSLTDGLSSP